MAALISCLYCNDKLDINVEYKHHLNSVHKVFKNLDKCIELSGKKMEGEKDKKPHVIEEITLESDDEHEITQNRVKENVAEDKYDIEKIAKETTAAIFSELRSLMNEKTKTKFDDEGLTALCKDDDSITQYFSKLRDKIKRTSIPDEVVDQFSKCKIKPDTADDFINKSFHEHDNLSTKKDEILKEIDHNCEVCEKDFETKDDLEYHLKTHKEEHYKNVKTKEPSILNKMKTNLKLQVLSTKREKRFMCPVSNCYFWTNKLGMQGGKAAVHLNKDHGIKPKDMIPGQYKFKKESVYV